MTAKSYLKANQVHPTSIACRGTIFGIHENPAKAYFYNKNTRSKTLSVGGGPLRTPLKMALHTKPTNGVVGS